MYFRVKRTGSYAYLQIVESFREQGQVRQRVLSTVGRLDTLQASGQLDTLMRSGLRFCEKLTVIDAHPIYHAGTSPWWQAEEYRFPDRREFPGVCVLKHRHLHLIGGNEGYRTQSSCPAHYQQKIKENGISSTLS